jgi:hypothetical protein
MKQLLLTLLLLPIFFMPVKGGCQSTFGSDSSNVISTHDTIIYRELDEIKVYPHKNKPLSQREYTRMVTKIKKVYPFAKEAAHELELYNEMYEKITSERERKKYVKKVEKELFAKHDQDIRKMTISEGRYLLLLIDRETGNTSYDLLKDIKGNLSAAFWQGIAKVFKNNLKEEYDPINKHQAIEQIVQQIEAGRL